MSLKNSTNINESSIKRVKMVHAKLADESQNTQSIDYKYINNKQININLLNFIYEKNLHK